MNKLLYKRSLLSFYSIIFLGAQAQSAQSGAYQQFVNNAAQKAIQVNSGNNNGNNNGQFQNPLPYPEQAPGQDQVPTVPPVSDPAVSSQAPASVPASVGQSPVYHNPKGTRTIAQALEANKDKLTAGHLDLSNTSDFSESIWDNPNFKTWRSSLENDWKTPIAQNPPSYMDLANVCPELIRMLLMSGIQYSRPLTINCSFNDLPVGFDSWQSSFFSMIIGLNSEALVGLNVANSKWPADSDGSDPIEQLIQAMQTNPDRFPMLRFINVSKTQVKPDALSRLKKAFEDVWTKNHPNEPIGEGMGIVSDIDPKGQVGAYTPPVPAPAVPSPAPAPVPEPEPIPEPAPVYHNPKGKRTIAQALEANKAKLAAGNLDLSNTSDFSNNIWDNPNFKTWWSSLENDWKTPIAQNPPSYMDLSNACPELIRMLLMSGIQYSRPLTINCSFNDLPVGFDSWQSSFFSMIIGLNSEALVGLNVANSKWPADSDGSDPIEQLIQDMQTNPDRFPMLRFINVSKTQVKPDALSRLKKAFEDVWTKNHPNEPIVAGMGIISG